MSTLTDNAHGTRAHRTSVLAVRALRALALPAVLSALACLFYWKLVFGGQILASYDLFTYFYPFKAYTAAAIAVDRLPLWNPDAFMGVPFLANIQTAVLYPPNLADLALAPPVATTASILLHVVLAGLFMYIFLRSSVRVGRAAAFLGGLVFMFSGFLGQQVGHINQLNASIWLPLLLAVFDWAHGARSPRRALIAGAILAFTLLAGHSQEAFLIGTIFAGYVAFRLVLLPVIGPSVGARVAGPNEELSRRPRRAAEGRAFLLLAGIVVLVVGASLAAVQLLPTYELSRESIRSGGLPYAEAVSFSLSPLLLAQSLLPGYLSNPFSEYIGYIGVAPLLLAVLALVGRSRDRFVWFALALVVASLVLAMGGYNPFYHLLYDHVPGFDLFRVPARWLYAYTFAMSMLAGLGADVLLRARGSQSPALGWRVRTLTLTLLVLGAGGSALWALRHYLLPPTPETPWLWMVFAGAGAVLIAAGLWRLRGPWLAVPLGCLFYGELLFASQGLEMNQPLPPETYATLPASVAELLSRADDGRVLSISSGAFAPGDEPELRRMLAGKLPDEQIEAVLVTLKYNQTLAPNTPMRFGLSSMDGYDGGVLPLRRYAQLKQMIAEQAGGGGTSADQADATLRLQLGQLPDSRLLGAMGVKYVLADKREDLWRDGVYYDLDLPAVATPESPAVLEAVPGFRATSLRLLSHLEEGSRVAPGDEVARLLVQAVDGGVQVLPIRAGVETDWLPPASAGTVAGLPATRPVALPDAVTYLSSLSFASPTAVRQVRLELTGSSGALRVDGLSFVDDRLGLSEPSPSNGAYRLIYSGDVKIYQNLDAKERLYLVQHAVVGETDAKTLELLARHPWDELVLSNAPGLDEQSLPPPGPQGAPDATSAPTRAQAGGSTDDGGAWRGSVRLLIDRPELRRAAVSSDRAALLMFAESSFPGWQARLDGQPVQLLRANYLFQAIAVPPGDHTVELAYDPRSLRIGWTVSAAAAALVAGTWTIASLPRLLRLLRRPSASSDR